MKGLAVVPGRRSAIIAVVALQFLCLTVAAHAQQTSKGLFGDAPADAPLVTVGATADRAQPSNRGVMRRREVVVHFLQMRGPATTSSDTAPGLVLNLFEDVSYAAVLDRVDQVQGGFVWVGRIPDLPESNVTLSVIGEVMAGSVVTRDAAYAIRYARPGVHEVMQINQADFPAEAQPLIPNVGAGAELARATADVTAGTGSDVNGDDGSFIDVMVLYTNTVISVRGTDAAVRALVNLGISETNTSYASSGITQRLRLVFAGPVAYTEADATTTRIGIANDLSNITSSVGALGGVAALRNAYAADMVTLLTHRSVLDACGIAWLQQSIGAGFAPYAYSVTDHQCVSPNFTFAHELGHNMGARHDWFMDTGISPHTYAHGYVNPSDGWRTIMAYADHCWALNVSCQRLLRWSNPLQTAPAPFPAASMGVPQGTSTACTAGNIANPQCDADDARTLNNTAPVVANFRQSSLFVTSLTPSLASPRPMNTAITWTATAASGTAPYTYKFLVYDGVDWTVGRDWHASNLWTWSPAVPGNYWVQVWVRNAGSVAPYDAYGGAGPYSITGPPPLSVTSLTPSLPSGVAMNTSVTWTATATGGTGPYTYKFLLYDGVAWTVARDWSASSTWTWTPAVAGTYFVQVWARNAGSSAGYDAWLAAPSFVVTGPPPLSVTALSPSPGSGAVIGASILWSAVATGGTGPYTYKFVVFDGANWIVGRDWNASNSWTWTPTSAGTYTVQVWARNAGSSAVYDAWRGAAFVVAPLPSPTVTSLSSSPLGGTIIGQSVLWTAMVSGGTSPYSYKFLLFDGVNWTVGRDWGAANTWNWTPTAIGTYLLQVWVRNAGSTTTYDAWLSSGWYTVSNPPPLTVTSFLPSPLTASVGGAVLWTATTSGGTAPYSYKFLVFDGTNWTLGRDWAVSNTWTWSPSGAGTYIVQVWVRNAGSSAEYDAWRNSGVYTVTGPPPLTITSLAPSPSTVTTGMTVSWTTVASGGSGPYTYRYLAFDGVNWTVPCEWSTSATCTWTPTAPGTYTIQVWARNAGSMNAYDAWRGYSGFVVTTTDMQSER